MSDDFEKNISGENENAKDGVYELLSQLLAQQKSAGSINDSENLYPEKQKGNIHTLLTKLLAGQKCTNALLALLLILMIVKLIFLG